MFDLVVIGAGSGGVRCARMAAQRGAKVAIIEKRFYGGTCVNVGCVPKKLFVYASHYGEEFHDAEGFGWHSSGQGFNWTTLVNNKNKEINRLNGVYEKLLKESDVTIFNGRGRIKSKNEVEVNGKTIQTKYILIATGSQAFVPDVAGREHALISDNMFYLENLPKHACVVGGGYIAVEFAGILQGLGVETHLVYRRNMLLRNFDMDVRQFVQEEVVKKGIQLHLNDDVVEIKEQQEKDYPYRLSLKSGESLNTGLVLYATGRHPATEELGCEEIGVDIGSRGQILVDDDYRTSIDTVFAIGDVIDRVQLTPVALAEGMYVANLLFGGQPVAVDYERIPTAVFSQPSIATIGPTEEQARAKVPRLQVYRSSFRALKNTMSGNQERTFMKLLVDGDTDKVLAAHMVGPEAAEIIQGISLAIRAGATKATFDTTIGIHPSSAEEFVTMREPVA